MTVTLSVCVCSHVASDGYIVCVCVAMSPKKNKQSSGRGRPVEAGDGGSKSAFTIQPKVQKTLSQRNKNLGVNAALCLP